MKPPKWNNGIFHVNLTKTEHSAVEKALGIASDLAKIQPVKKELSDAASAAVESLTAILTLAGNEVAADLPLFTDDKPEPGNS